MIFHVNTKTIYQFCLKPYIMKHRYAGCGTIMTGMTDDLSILSLVCDDCIPCLQDFYSIYPDTDLQEICYMKVFHIKILLYIANCLHIIFTRSRIYLILTYSEDGGEILIKRKI